MAKHIHPWKFNYWRKSRFIGQNQQESKSIYRHHNRALTLILTINTLDYEFPLCFWSFDAERQSNRPIICERNPFKVIIPFHAEYREIWRIMHLFVPYCRAVSLCHKQMQFSRLKFVLGNVRRLPSRSHHQKCARFLSFSYGASSFRWKGYTFHIRNHYHIIRPII